MNQEGIIEAIGLCIRLMPCNRSIYLQNAIDGDDPALLHETQKFRQVLRRVAGKGAALIKRFLVLNYTM
jgi:hypothetical protein